MILFICRTELAFDCFKTLASRFKNSPNFYKIQLEHLVRFHFFNFPYMYALCSLTSTRSSISERDNLCHNEL